nr:MAG: hypothetical protein 4 [Guangxi cystovirus 1]
MLKVFTKPVAEEIGYTGGNVQSNPLRITHTIVDRLAGSSIVETICGKEPNLSIVATRLKKNNVRKQAAEFFITHGVTNVLKDVISTQTVREGEAQTTVDMLIKAINSNVKGQDLQSVVAEFVVPLAYKVGLIVGKTEITTIVEYPVAPVTISDLSLELAAQSALLQYNEISTNGLFTPRMAKAAYIQAFAESLRPIGFDLNNSRNIQHILDDVVKGVYVHIMSPSRVETIGDIEETWLNSQVVAELMSCYPFIAAALEGSNGKNLHGSRNVRPRNDAYTLDREAPMALARLKGSKRYAFFSRDEYLSTFGKNTICDLDGSPLFFALYQEAELQPIAQALNVFEDAVLSGVAKNIVATEDHVTKFIASSLPRGESMKLTYHVNRFLNALQHVIESGDIRLRHEVSDLEEGKKQPLLATSIGIQFGVHGDTSSDDAIRELAWMYADEVFISYDEELKKVTPLYRVVTEHKNLHDLTWSAGLAPDGTFVTTDEGMVFLLGRDFSSKQSVAPRAQLIGSSAINTRVVGLDVDARLVGDERISFNLSIGGTRVTGKVNTHDIGMQDLSEFTVFVKALHNAKVSETFAHVHQALIRLEEDVNLLASTPMEDGDDEAFGHTLVTHQLVSFLQQARLMSLITMADSVSPQYRSIVRSVLQMEAMATLKPAEVFRLKGLLKQRSFQAYSDLFALQLVLTTCGLDSSYIEKALTSEQLSNVILRLS